MIKTGTSEGSDWVQDRLAEISRQLEEGQWPEPAARLLFTLLNPNSDTQLPAGETPLLGQEAEERDIMLSLAVNDALEGVDISAQYPAFYQRLLADNDLRSAFLDSLDLLRRSQTGKLEPLPQPASQNLSFLRSKTNAPIIEPASPNGRWRVLWERTIDDIHSILFSPRMSTSPLFRGPAEMVEDPWFTLINSEVEVAERRISVLLQATQNAERPESLQLFLTVGVMPLTGEEASPLNLRANLRWGSYGLGVLVDSNGQATFSAVPFGTVLTANRQSVKSHLYLSLEPVIV